MRLKAELVHYTSRVLVQGGYKLVLIQYQSVPFPRKDHDTARQIEALVRRSREPAKLKQRQRRRAGGRKTKALAEGGGKEGYRASREGLVGERALGLEEAVVVPRGLCRQPCNGRAKAQQARGGGTTAKIDGLASVEVKNRNERHVSEGEEGGEKKTIIWRSRHKGLEGGGRGQTHPLGDEAVEVHVVLGLPLVHRKHDEAPAPLLVALVSPTKTPTTTTLAGPTSTPSRFLMTIVPT